MKRIKTEGIVKLALTFALSIFSLIVAIITRNIFILIGMVLSTGGDIQIMASRDALSTGKNKTQFTKGVVFFAIAHLAYVLSMQETKWWSTIIGFEVIFCILVCIIAILTKMKGNILLNACYAICIIFAVINSWQFHWLAGIGYMFFVISDLILIIFEDKNPKWQIPIWITYVVAQICIISSFLMA